MTTHSTSALAEALGGRLVGDGEIQIEGVAPIHVAGPGHLTFLDDDRGAELLKETRAGAILVATEPPEENGGALILVPNVRLALAQALELFHPPARWGEGVDAAAAVDETAELAPDVRVGPRAVVGPRCRIGAGTRIEAGAVVYPDVEVGADCWVHAGCVLREQTVLGDRVILHPGVVLGGDGFGYAMTEEHTHHKVPQVGHVVIEDDVEIGANACIDRATMGVTLVRRGAKIDNLVQIGHNCDIGEHVIVCGQVGMAGSCTIEHHAVLAGQVGLADHLTIGAAAQIGAQSGIASVVPPGAKLIGTPAVPGKEWWRQAVAQKKLPELIRRVRALEQRIAERGVDEGE